MAFNIALTGIDTSQTYLDVTANNIANAASIGFKKSRGEFADVYSSGIYQNVNVAVGQGAKTAAVSQQFEQGSMQRTGSVLDLSIDGTGFFATSKQKDNYDFQYTRAGAFKLDNESFIVNAFGDYLRAFPVNEDGTTTTISMAATKAVKIPTSLGDPEETENIDFTVNFPVETDPKESKDLSKFDPTDSTTYNYSTASIFYDSVGTRHTLNVYYIKPGREMQLASGESGMVDLSVVYDPNGSMDYKTAWAAFYEINGTPIQPLNKDQNDVEGYAYEARNLTTPDYPHGRALDPNFLNQPNPPIATSISVNNTKVGEGKLYPGKIASSTPDNVVPDNETTAVDQQDLHIVNGDKTNQDRPKDFWRCEFLFMGRGETDMFEPTDPVVLQPLGYVDEKIGEKAVAGGAPIPLEPVTIVDTKIIVDSAQFHAARTGETGTLTVSLDVTVELEDDGGDLFNPYTFDVPIDESITTVPQLAAAMQTALNSFKSETVNHQSDPADTDRVTPAEYDGITIADALILDGYTLSIDPVTAEFIVEQNQKNQTDKGGQTGAFENVNLDYKVTDVGVPKLTELGTETFTISKFNPVDDANDQFNSAFTFTLDGENGPQSFILELGTATTTATLINPQNAEEFIDNIKTSFEILFPPTTSDYTFKVMDTGNQFQIVSKFLDTTDISIKVMRTTNAMNIGKVGVQDLAFDFTDSSGVAAQVTGGRLDSTAYPGHIFNAEPIPAAIDSGTEFQLYLQNEDNDTQTFTVTTGETIPNLGNNIQPTPDVNATSTDPNVWSAEFTMKDLVPMTLQDRAMPVNTCNIDTDGGISLDFDLAGTDVSISVPITDTMAKTSTIPMILDAIVNAIQADTNVDNAIRAGEIIVSRDGNSIKFVGTEDSIPSANSFKWSFKTYGLDQPAPYDGNPFSFKIDGKDIVSDLSGAEAALPVIPYFETGGIVAQTTTPIGSTLPAKSPVTWVLDDGYPVDASTGQPLTAGSSSNSVVALDDPNDLGADVLYGAAAPDQELTIRYVDNTMYDADFQVLDIHVDGAAVGRLTSIDISTDGLIQATFTNGTTQPMGRVALARFNNEQGLLKVGNTSWVQSVASGKAIAGQARSGTFGDINSATLEQSNADLSTQLVDLIIAQRNYQANARSLEVDSTLQQTILQIR